MTESLKRKLAMLPPDILDRIQEHKARTPDYIPGKLSEPGFKDYVDKISVVLKDDEWTNEEVDTWLHENGDLIYQAYATNVPYEDIFWDLAF